ncbi:MAG: glycosyltransferase family 87 protein [Amphiplicatus sp.]
MREKAIAGEAEWFTRARVTRFSLAAILSYCAGAIAAIATARNGWDALGIPLGFDFLAFHGAARLAVDGQLASAFDPQVFTAALEQELPGVGYGYFWLYPPTFATILLPFGLLSYGTAFWVWTAAGLSVYSSSAWAVTRNRVAVIACLGFTATWVTAYHGQNSFFSAALFILAVHFLLGRKDRLAGIAIGLLAFKPHLAILFPLALAASGRWRAFVSAAATAVLFSLASIAVFGWGYIDAFVEHGQSFAAALLTTERHWATITSVYVSASLAGLPPQLAWTLHALVAAAAAALVLARFIANGATRETLALLTAASLLISPYVMDYDLTVLAAAGLLLFAAGEHPRHAMKWEQAAAFSVAMIPILIVGLGRLGLQIGWLAPVIVIVIAETRLRRLTPQAPRSRAALAAK